MPFTYLTDGGKSPKRAVKRGPKRTRSAVCPFSPSCFTCPKPDCISGGKHAYNEIVDDELYFELIGKYTQY